MNQEKNIIREMHKVLSTKINMILPDLKKSNCCKLSKITEEQAEIFLIFGYKIEHSILKEK